MDIELISLSGERHDVQRASEEVRRSRHHFDVAKPWCVRLISMTWISGVHINLSRCY